MKKVIESLIKINFIFFIGMIALTLLSIINTNNKIMIYILASSFQLILVSFEDFLRNVESKLSKLVNRNNDKKLSLNVLVSLGK